MTLARFALFVAGESPGPLLLRLEAHTNLAARERFCPHSAAPGQDLSIVDVAALPWCYRLSLSANLLAEVSGFVSTDPQKAFRALPTSGIFTCGIIECYRDASFAYDRVAFAPLQTWLDACLALPAVKETLPDPERLVDARANLGAVLFRENMNQQGRGTVAACEGRLLND